MYSFVQGKRWQIRTYTDDVDPRLKKIDIGDKHYIYTAYKKLK